ncbi:MAG TPA: gluconokinase [Geminicoccus sp.]|uniref:gluconokinase n=1 Tax=Geminicoccus sp. TaxID=2024832 RepID=UPI002C513563|nr:gluconokinase [Geminicoccus sp.]HWL71831.1 gluconokinase [Geminicoccus sp.]
MTNLVVVVMGVTSSGKTTVAKAIAEKRGWPFQEGDALHPEANVAKMSKGIPLTDEDRWPWLDKVAAWIDARLAAGESGVITCSMLKRIYRDKVIGDRQGVRILFLNGEKSLIAERMAKRKGHYMPTSLLDSQIVTLEPPGSDERPLRVDIGLDIDQMVDQAQRLVDAALREG